ncbi:MAG: redoxin domain-containing protein [Patescibacteria group bacterium]
MKENKINTILIAAVGAITVLLVGAVIVFSPGFGKTSNNPTTSGDLENHHADVPPDQSVFNSLLGKNAPDFVLESYDGKIIELQKLRGKKVVLFFTEGLMCYPACWDQMAAFGEDSSLNNSDVQTFSIAVDNKNDWTQAIAKMPELSKVMVLFDTDRKVSQTYGMLTLPSSMHKGQYPGHTYVIIDRKGVIRFTYDDPIMGIRNEILLKELDKIR